MRAIGSLVVVAVVAGALAGSAGARQAAKCRTTDTVLAQNRFIRVWEHATDPANGKLIACRRDDGHRMTMLKTRRPVSQGDPSTLFEKLTLNRRFAAFEVIYDDSLGRRIKLRSFNTKAGHRRLEAGNGAVAVDALVVTSKGAVAWAEPAGTDEAIQAADASGTNTLDSGAIDPKSLGVELTIVSWTNAGEERFARLR